MKRVIFVILIALAAMLCTACGEKGPHEPTTLTVNESTTTKFAEIACRMLEEPKVIAYREDYLCYFGDATEMPIVTRAIEVDLPKDENHERIHMYIMHIAADILIKDANMHCDGFNIVYDCDTDTILTNAFGWTDPNSFPEYSREYYQFAALSLGNLNSEEPLEENWIVFQDTEAHAIFDDAQLAEINENLQPEGWYSRREVIISMDEIPNEATQSNEATPPAPISIDLVPISDSEALVDFSAAVLNECAASGGFSPQEITGLKLQKGAVYTCKDVLPDGSAVHYLYLWLDANQDIYGYYAGQVLVNLDTGTVLTLALFSEENINIDTVEGFDQYYYWMGNQARNETGFIINEEEQTTYLSGGECEKINALIAEAS